MLAPGLKCTKLHNAHSNNATPTVQGAYDIPVQVLVDSHPMCLSWLGGVVSSTSMSWMKMPTSRRQNHAVLQRANAIDFQSLLSLFYQFACNKQQDMQLAWQARGRTPVEKACQVSSFFSQQSHPHFDELVTPRVLYLAHGVYLRASWGRDLKCPKSTKDKGNSGNCGRYEPSTSFNHLRTKVCFFSEASPSSPFHPVSLGISWKKKRQDAGLSTNENLTPNFMFCSALSRGAIVGLDLHSASAHRSTESTAFRHALFMTSLESLSNIQHCSSSRDRCSLASRLFETFGT